MPQTSGANISPTASSPGAGQVAEAHAAGPRGAGLLGAGFEGSEGRGHRSGSRGGGVVLIAGHPSCAQKVIPRNF